MDTPVVNGTPYPYLNVAPKAYRFRILNASNDRFWNLQMYKAKSNTATVDGLGRLLQTDSGEVSMTVAAPRPGDPTWPATWPTDGRAGGVPDPTMVGPSWIQIGTEGGFLPKPVVIPPQPIGYNYNRRDIVVLNVQDKSLYLGPAERADVIVDFSQYAPGTRIILYNDAPAPVPAFDPRSDFYTGAPDQTDTGGSPGTQAGYGPNTRTVMQFVVQAGAAAPAFDTTALATALPAAYALTQDVPIVPQKAYGYATDTFSKIQSANLTFTPVGSSTATTFTMERKAIQELFEMDYGRMNATLGNELPFTNSRTQTTLPFGFVDPATEFIKDSGTTGSHLVTLGDGTQIWKITHNGVDTHAIHFHLFNVQLINRVGWDGAIRPPDANELGWKETVKMNPLEDCIVAFRAVSPSLPFKIGDSVRLLDPTRPPGTTTQFSGFDPVTGNPVVVENTLQNFGWEYVWHCHLLGHEENDMMRPMVFEVSPAAPTTLTATPQNGPARISLAWTNHATDPAATNYYVERAANSAFTGTVTTFSVSAASNTLIDTAVVSGTTYYYRVRAENANSFSAWSNTASALITAPTTRTLTIFSSASSVRRPATFLLFGTLTPPRSWWHRDGVRDAPRHQPLELLLQPRPRRSRELVVQVHPGHQRHLQVLRHLGGSYLPDHLGGRDVTRRTHCPPGVTAGKKQGPSAISPAAPAVCCAWTVRVSRSRTTRRAVPRRLSSSATAGSRARRRPANPTDASRSTSSSALTRTASGGPCGVSRGAQSTTSTCPPDGAAGAPRRTSPSDPRARGAG